MKMIKYDHFALEKLIPYATNAKIHTEAQLLDLMASISQFGFTQPVVVDENLIILVGHGRTEAAKRLGMIEIPVWQLLELTEQQKNAYRIADNKINLATGFDQEILADELTRLVDGGFDLNSFSLCDLVIKEKPEDLKEDAFDPRKENSTSIERGDLIQLNDHRLYCGDSSDPFTTRKLFEGGGTARLMVTDPPYGVNYDPAWRNGIDLGTKAGRAIGGVTNDGLADWTPVFELWNPEIIYCWHAGIYADLVAAGLKQLNYKIISQIIWVKQHFVLSRGDYHWKHEPCWYAARGNHNWQGARDQSTVWEIANAGAFGGEGEQSGHSTQKPLECMARPIRNNSLEGDIISDPFLGSGSTLIAADMLKRICYGAELEPGYCQLIVDRFINHKKKNNQPCKITINNEPILDESYATN